MIFGKNWNQPKHYKWFAWRPVALGFSETKGYAWLTFVERNYTQRFGTWYQPIDG